MKQIRTRSGLRGVRMRLRSSYMNFAEFVAYDEVYNLSLRLGYKSAESAWTFNPLVEGSTNPTDYCKVYANGRRVYWDGEMKPEWSKKSLAETAVG